MKMGHAMIFCAAWMLALAPVLPQRAALAGGAPATVAAACVTVFGAANCGGLAGPSWQSASCGRAYLFKDLWGKAKLPLGPKNAGVGYLGPVCWSGPPPQPGPLTPTTAGWQPNLDPQSKKNTDWEAVKDLGDCCLCCSFAAILPPPP